VCASNLWSHLWCTKWYLFLSVYLSRVGAVRLFISFFQEVSVIGDDERLSLFFPSSNVLRRGLFLDLSTSRTLLCSILFGEISINSVLKHFAICNLISVRFYSIPCVSIDFIRSWCWISGFTSSQPSFSSNDRDETLLSTSTKVSTPIILRLRSAVVTNTTPKRRYNLCCHHQVINTISGGYWNLSIRVMNRDTSCILNRTLKEAKRMQLSSILSFVDHWWSKHSAALSVGGVERNKPNKTSGMSEIVMDETQRERERDDCVAKTIHYSLQSSPNCLQPLTSHHDLHSW